MSNFIIQRSEVSRRPRDPIIDFHALLKDHTGTTTTRSSQRRWVRRDGCGSRERSSELKRDTIMMQRIGWRGLDGPSLLVHDGHHRRGFVA